LSALIDVWDRTPIAYRQAGGVVGQSARPTEGDRIVITRRDAIASVASIAAAPIAAAASAAPVIPAASSGPLPEFPVPGMPLDEIIRRLIAWCGGPRRAVFSLTSSISNGANFGEATEGQYDHIVALCDALERGVGDDDRPRPSWPGNDDHPAAVAEACRRYGYDHRRPKWLDRPDAE
jgi:hypothetical protein